MKVLIAAHIGEPLGGISVNYENLLNSKLKELVQLSFVEVMGNSLSHAQRGKYKFRNFLDLLKNISNYCKAILISKPEVVHIASAYGPSFVKSTLFAVFAKALGAKVYIQLHCTFSRIIPSNNSLKRKIVIWALNLCDGVIVLSKEWMALCCYIPIQKIFLVPNAIDLTQYTSIERPRSFKVEGGVQILFLGHIGREKGIYDLIYAVELITKNYPKLEYQVKIFGEELHPGELAYINKEVVEKKLESRIHISPSIYGNQKIEELSRADIFVLPSHHEGMPISIIEAMAAGLPVVATNVGGIPDMICSASGLLVKPGDSQKLSNALLELIIDSRKRNQLGLSAREIAIEKFSIARKVDLLTKIYNNQFS